MNFTAQILFFFGALGVFNSLLLSIYFIFFSKLKRRTNILFGLFLLFLSIRVLKSLFYFFATEEPIPLLQTGPAIFIFIGPFLYSYFSVAFKKNGAVLKTEKYHIAIWILIALGIYFIYPFKEYIALNKNVVLPFINVQWLCYILASGYIVRPTIKKLFRKNPDLSAFEKWSVLLLASILILWVVYFLIPYNYFITGSIVFSIFFYGFFLFFVFNKKKAVAVFSNKKKYNNGGLETQQVNLLIEKLNNLMTRQKLFKNPSLKLSDLAYKLNITTHQLSQLLNDNLGKSFSAFINEYRVEEAKLLLFQNTKYTLEAIGNQAGFKSKTTFFTTFKKMVGMTPSRYKAQF